MKNKTWIWICAVILVILAILLIWKPFGSKTAQTEPAVEQTATPEPAQQAAPAQTEVPQLEETSEDQPEEEEETGAYILEDEGDLIIVIPEGEGSAGF